MSIKEFTLASILTATVIIIELLVITTGEALVVITILSAIPLYIISIKNTIFGISSYLCVSVLLIILNPHQAMFFMFTNGMIGLMFGICDQKIKNNLSIIITGIALSMGIMVVVYLVGMFDMIKKHWYIPIFIILISIIYVTILRLIIKKIIRMIQPLLDKF